MNNFTCCLEQHFDTTLKAPLESSEPRVLVEMKLNGKKYTPRNPDCLTRQRQQKQVHRGISRQRNSPGKDLQEQESFDAEKQVCLRRWSRTSEMISPMIFAPRTIFGRSPRGRRQTADCRYMCLDLAPTNSSLTSAQGGGDQVDAII